MLLGTTQLSMGNDWLTVSPPVNIWHDKDCPAAVALSIPGELKDNLEPGVGAPAVIFKGGLAGIPKSHPEMKPPASARTDDGVSPMSNAEGMEAPPLRTLAMDE